MAFPTPVNDLLTDGSTQVQALVLASGSGIAVGNLAVATSQALALAAQQATSAQHQGQIHAQALAMAGIATLYALDAAVEAAVTAEILEAGHGEDAF